MPGRIGADNTANGLVDESALPPSIPADNLVNNETACYTAWYSWLSTLRSSYSASSTRKAPTIELSTITFETIQTFGPGTTYTECDNIPRFRFTGAPTRTSNSLVTITVTRDNAEGPFEPLYPTDSPQCTIGRELCDKLLLEARERYIGNGVHGRLADAPYSLCPTRPFCKLSLREVVLIYWPENFISRDICGKDGYGKSEVVPPSSKIQALTTITTDAITFRGRDLYLRSVNGEQWFSYARSKREYIEMEEFVRMINGTLSEQYILPSTMYGTWTFTYPTVYLAHREITANMVHSVRRGLPFITSLSIRPAGIIPLDRDDISSIRWIMYHNNTVKGGLETAQLVAKGLFRPTVDYYVNGDFETRSFDFGQLVDPVPASVYYDAHDQDCWAEQTHCATITDDSYRPRLRLADRVWQSLLPDGFKCEDPMIVDPPIALKPIEINQEAVYQSREDSGYFVTPAPGESVRPWLPAATENPDESGREEPSRKKQKNNANRTHKVRLVFVTILPCLLVL